MKNKKFKKWVRVDNNNNIISYSGIYRKLKPKIGRWLEIVPVVKHTTSSTTTIEETTIQPIYGNRYYVANSGDDNNNGLSPETAWQTINKINNSIFEPGDVISFKSDDVFTGTVNINTSGESNKPIVYNAYGIGNKPIINGATKVTGWSLHSGNIYKATFSNKVNQVFVDGVKMKVSSSGDFETNTFFQINTVVNDTTFRCDNLENIDVTDAYIMGRFAAWSLETIKVDVSSYFPLGQIALVKKPYYSLLYNYPFIVLNALHYLNGAGQWCWSESENTLYLWTPNGDNPDNYNVEVSVNNNGFEGTNVSYIDIENIEVRNFGKEGISIDENCSNINITNNVFTDNYISGINLSHYINPNTTWKGVAENCNISNNIINGSASNGLLTHGNNMNISYNTINDIGLSKTLGIEGLVVYEHGAQGMYLYIENSTVNNNIIHDVGYNNITYLGINNIIENNKLSKGCRILSDGGAIYTYTTNTNTIIRKNYISDMGTEFTADAWVHAIYTDMDTNGITIDDNIINGNIYGIGIFTSHTRNSKIRRNIVYNSKVGFSGWKSSSYDPDFSNNILSDNIFYCVNPQHICIDLSFPETIWDASRITLSGNSYYHVNNMVPNTYYSVGPYTISQWKTLTGEINAKGFDNFIWSYDNIQIASSNYLSNPTFDNDTSGWGGSPTWDNTYLDNGCGRWDTYNLWNDATVAANMLRMLSFDIIAPNHEGFSTLYVNNIDKGTSIFDNIRRRFTYIFKDDSTYINFQLSGREDGVYRYYDNFELVDIIANEIPPTEKSKLFYNNTNATVVQDFDGNNYTDLDGIPIASLTLQPYTATILLRN